MDDTQALLEQLNAPRLPEASLWPAPGWWLLFALLILGACLVFWRHRRQRQRFWLQEAQAELESLRRDVNRQPSSDILGRTSRLVRRILLLVHPRRDVASLHGEPLLAALDELCPQPVFSSGYGRLLLTGPYERTPEVGADDLSALLDSVESLCDGAASHAPRGARR